MSRASSVDVGILSLGGYDLLGFSTMFTHNVEAMTEEAHLLNSTWVFSDTVGMKKGTIEQNGFFTVEAAGSNQALAAGLGSGRVAGLFSRAGNPPALGSKITMFLAALESAFNITAERGALVKANASYSASGEIVDGILIYNSSIDEVGTEGAVTDTGATVYIDGGVGVLQVLSIDLDGATGLIVRIMESADSPVSYAEMIEFAPITTDDPLAPHVACSQAIDVSGLTVGPRYKVTFEWTGTPGSNASARVQVGLYVRPVTA